MHAAETPSSPHSPLLPGDVWEMVLASAGPLALCADVGACPRTAAATRVQRAWRRAYVAPREGLEVVYAFPGQPWREGKLVRCGALSWMVQRVDDPRRKWCYVFLPHPTVRIRQKR